MLYGWLKIIGKIILRKHTILGTENIIGSRSAVFICNHSGAYGPIAVELYFPYKYRPWVIYYVTAKKLCRQHLREVFAGKDHDTGNLFIRLLAAAIEPLCLWVMGCVNAIPVYRKKREIFKTFSISVEALINGANIVIFPEKDDVQYTKYVNDFYSGFVYLAKKYYVETGSVLHFYPMYASRKSRVIAIGRPVAYMPQADFQLERNRIAKKLRDEMDRIAVNLNERKK